MKRFYLTALSCAFFCTSSVYATTYARWTFDEPANSPLTSTINGGSTGGTWSNALTSGSSAKTNGAGSLLLKTSGVFADNQTYWLPGSTVVSTGLVYVTIKFEKFVLNSSAGSYGEILCLSTNNQSPANYAQAMIYLRRNPATNGIEVRGMGSSNPTASSGSYTDYIQLSSGYSLPDGLILTMAVDYGNLTYAISAKVGGGDWQNNICTGTLYAGASLTGLRFQAGNNFSQVDDDVRIDEISVSTIHPSREIGVSGSSVGGSLSVAGSLDLLGNEITFGNGSGLYGAGLLYDPADGSLIFDLPQATASWLWQRGNDLIMTLGEPTGYNMDGLGLLQRNGEVAVLLSRGGQSMFEIGVQSPRFFVGIPSQSDPYTEISSGRIAHTANQLPLPFELKMSEVTGDAVSVVGAPRKLVKTNELGKIDLSFFDLSNLQAPAGSGIVLAAASSNDITLSTSGDGGVRIRSSLQSESPNTGALTVDGGLGVAGHIRTSGWITSSDLIRVERLWGSIEIGGQSGGYLNPGEDVLLQFSSGEISASITFDSISNSLNLNYGQEGDGALPPPSGRIATVVDIENASSASSAASKLVKAKSSGKIDPSFLPTIIRIAPAGDLSMGEFASPMPPADIIP